MMFLDINPINLGHSLVVPKNHSEYLFEMEDGQYQELMSAVKQVSAPLREAMQTKRIGLVVEGFLVPHVHVHLIPINQAGELDPKRAKKADNDELKALADKIRPFF